jgi:DNA primase
VDTKMNGEEMTIASTYFVRQRRGPPVATPLESDELEPGLEPTSFTMIAGPARGTPALSRLV